MIACNRMARRPDNPSTEQLTRTQLDEVRRRLEAMPLWELENFYKATHNACRYSVRVPSPRMIQELVQAWKLLWKQRGNLRR